MKHCYKVVSVTECGRYGSAVLATSNWLFAEYRLGIKTEAKVGKLLVFRQKRHAKKFVNVGYGRHSWVILRGTCSEYTTVKSLLGLDYVSDKKLIQEFWAEYPLRVALPAPIGTWGVDWFIPEGEV
jgi:hypothetical protein